MDTETMITNITNSIQTEENLIILITASVTANLQYLPDEKLAAICQLLNLPTE